MLLCFCNALVTVTSYVLKKNVLYSLPDVPCLRSLRACLGLFLQGEGRTERGRGRGKENPRSRAVQSLSACREADLLPMCGAHITSHPIPSHLVPPVYCTLCAVPHCMHCVAGPHHVMTVLAAHTVYFLLHRSVACFNVEMVIPSCP